MYRERAAGMYDEMPFAIAQCLVELPYNLLQALLFVTIAYFMLGFENDVGARSGDPCDRCVCGVTTSVLATCFAAIRRHPRSVLAQASSSGSGPSSS